MSSRNESRSASRTPPAGTAQTGRSAPAPDDERKPDGPTELDGASWTYIVLRSIREFSREKCTDLATGPTYFAMLSLFPAFMALVSLLGPVGQSPSTTQTTMLVKEGVASPEVAYTLRQPIGQLASAPSTGFALITGRLGALWNASGDVGAFGCAVNRFYDVQEGAPSTR